MSKLISGDGLTVTYKGVEISNSISISIGEKILEDTLTLEAQTATGKKGQIAGSRFTVGDTTVTAGSDSTHWGLEVGNPACTSVAGDLVATICVGGVQTTITLPGMVFGGPSAMSLEQRSESTTDLIFQHEDLDGTLEYPSFS